MADYGKSDAAYLTTLHNLMDRSFDLEEFRTLCVSLGVDYDNLRGEGKLGKMREFVWLMARQSRLVELVEEARRARPSTDWPPVLQDFGVDVPAPLDAAAEQAKTEQHIHIVQTGGGAYIGGSVNTSVGDFVGRDKISPGGDYVGRDKTTQDDA